MSEPHDPNAPSDVSSVPAGSLDAGLAAGFGRQAQARGRAPRRGARCY